MWNTFHYVISRSKNNLAEIRCFTDYNQTEYIFICVCVCEIFKFYHLQIIQTYRLVRCTNAWWCHFQLLCKNPPGLVSPPSVLLVRRVEGEHVPGLQTLLVHPPFVPRLPGVLPPLLLRVWKGQQGQHGEGKEGRLCPPRPPGCPEGKGAWRAVEQRKRVSGKKETFPLLFLSLVFSPTFCSPFSHFLSLSLCLYSFSHWF